jgi:type VI secretion system secreted protein VgrG
VALQAKNDPSAPQRCCRATPVNNVPTELGGTTLTPGVYALGHARTDRHLTLDGNGVYIFQAGSTLITARAAA